MVLRESTDLASSRLMPDSLAGCFTPAAASTVGRISSEVARLSDLLGFILPGQRIRIGVRTPASYGVRLERMLCASASGPCVHPLSVTYITIVFSARAS